MIYSKDDLTFQILAVDRFFHTDGVHNVKARPYAAFSFRIRGEGRFFIGNRELVTREGDILFLPANQPYKVQYSSCESIVVHLVECNCFEAENITLYSEEPLRMRFISLLGEFRQSHLANRAKAQLYGILDAIETDRKNALPESAFQRCVRYMETEFKNPDLDVAGVSEYAFISTSTLERDFQKHLGISPKKYLIRLRMNRALELLTSTNISVREVAYSSGFKDEKYFSRAFKEKYGCSPSSFKNRLTV